MSKEVENTLKEIQEKFTFEKIQAELLCNLEKIVQDVRFNTAVGRVMLLDEIYDGLKYLKHLRIISYSEYRKLRKFVRCYVYIYADVIEVDIMQVFRYF